MDRKKDHRRGAPGVRAGLQMVMSETPVTDEVRARAAGRAYAQLATAMLRERKPSPASFQLLTATIVAAALAGDRTFVATVPSLLAKLSRYLPSDQAWSGDWRGRFRTLGLVVEIGDELLAFEYLEQVRAPELSTAT